MSQTTRTNLATNPVPGSTTNYAAVPGTGGAATLAHFFASNRVTWTTAPTAGGGASYSTTPVTPGTVYSVQIQVSPSKTITLQLSVDWLTGAGAVISTSTATAVSVSTGTAFTLLTLPNITAPATAATMRVNVLQSGATNWAVNNTLDVADVCIETGAVCGPYFDGTLTNGGGTVYAWTGTPNASTSTATTYVPAMTLSGATDAPCPRAVITLTDLTPTDNKVTVWRTAAGVRAPVRTTQGLTVNGSGAVTDYEAPLGRSVTYDLEILSGATKGAPTPTASVTVTPPLDAAGKATWWIQDPLVPGTAVALSVNRQGGNPSLTAAAVKALEYASDVAVIPIMGSPLPVAIGGQRMAAAGVDFSTFTNTAQQTTNLRGLLATASVLLIRSPGVRNDGVPALMYTAAPKVVEQPVTVAFGGTLTRWQLTGTSVAAPTASILVPVWTYGAVANLWATYQQAQTALAAKTYLDVLKSPSGA